jgi:hypothetical protein
MKSSICALLLLRATTSVFGRPIARKLQEPEVDLIGKKDESDSIGKGKGNSIGKGKGGSTGKKGNNGNNDCTENFMVLMGPCPILINRPGRYVLEEDLECGPMDSGIGIVTDDVLLDCRGNEIRTSSDTLPAERGFFGIGVTGSAHATVTNCNVRRFFRGLYADQSMGDWNDLTIENSSFQENSRDGMLLVGSADELGENTVLVLGSQFNNNGGDGVEVAAIDGTFISSQMNGNFRFDESGIDENGFLEIEPSFLKFYDVTTNNNGDAGIFTQDTSQSLDIIKSTACNNDVRGGSMLADIDTPDIDVAQGNTCDTSNPDRLNGRRICQCTCQGGRVSNTESSNKVSIAAPPETSRRSTPLVILANETVAYTLFKGF